MLPPAGRRRAFITTLAAQGLAVVAHALARPGSGEDLQRFIEHLAAPPVIGLLARRRQFAAETVAAQAGAEGEATAAEPVQRHGLPGDLGRPPTGQRRDHGAQPQPLSSDGDRRQGDPRVGHLPDRFPPAQVIPDEHPVPAGLLRLGGQPRDHPRVSEITGQRHPQRRPQPGGHWVRPGSFGRAAARLGYSQSTISQQIAALEKAVGGAAFDRPGGPKPVRITPLGAVVPSPRARPADGGSRDGSHDVRADTALSVHELQPPLPPREIFLLWEKGRTHSPLAARTIDIAVSVAASITEEKDSSAN